MPTISILSQSSPDKSVDENSSKLINMYLQPNRDPGLYPMGAYYTPGLTVFATLPASPVRALFEQHNITYAVGGNKFYRVSNTGVVTELGTLNTSSGFAKIRGIHAQLMIIDGVNGYIYDLNTLVFSTITDVNFTNTATDLNAQDEFFMVSEPNSQTWQISAISDGTTWTVLGIPQFASVTGNGNNLVALWSLQRQIWLFSEDTTEVWYNAGATGFTFARNESAYIEIGACSRDGIAYADNTLFVLGKSRTGGPVAVRMNGYSPEIISTPAISYEFSTYSTVSDCIAFAYSQEGHEFVVFTFPTAGTTWVYDVSVGAWHQRQSLISSIQTRWRPSCYVFCYNLQLVGDSQSGNIYKLDMTSYTENGTAITRTIQSHPFYDDGKLQFVGRLHVDLDQTPGSSLSSVNLYISRDGGNTFGAAKAATPQQDSNGMWRVYWTRLGSARRFCLKLTTTMNNKFIVLGAWAISSTGTPQ